jgi:hypothetical protein
MLCVRGAGHLATINREAQSGVACTLLLAVVVMLSPNILMGGAPTRNNAVREANLEACKSKCLPDDWIRERQIVEHRDVSDSVRHRKAGLSKSRDNLLSRASGSDELCDLLLSVITHGRRRLLSAATDN